MDSQLVITVSKPKPTLTVQQLLVEKVNNFFKYTKIISDAAIVVASPLAVSYIYQYLRPLLVDFRSVTDGLLEKPLQFGDIPLHIESHRNVDVRELLIDLCRNTVNFFIKTIGGNDITEADVIKFMDGEPDPVIWFNSKYNKDERLKIFKYLDLFLYILIDNGLLEPFE